MSSAVLVGMMLCRFSSVMSRMLSVPMRDVGVMPALLVIPTLVMLGSFKVVFRGVLVVISRFAVVVRTFMCHHSVSTFQELVVSRFFGKPSIQDTGQRDVFHFEHAKKGDPQFALLIPRRAGRSHNAVTTQSMAAA